MLLRIIGPFLKKQKKKNKESLDHKALINDNLINNFILYKY